MNKARKWIQPLFVFAALLAFIIWDTRHGTEIDKEIKLHGTIAHAVVVRTYLTKGVAIDLEFFYGGKFYTATNQHAAFQAATGDSIAILFLPNQLDSKILLEERIFTVPRKP